MERRPTTVVAPPGYAERVALALRALPGDGPERAARLGVTLSYLYQAQRGHRGWRDAAGLAAACGVPEVLLVYGPTEELARELARPTADEAEYDRVTAILARGEAGAVMRHGEYAKMVNGVDGQVVIVEES